MLHRSARPGSTENWGDLWPPLSLPRRSHQETKALATALFPDSNAYQWPLLVTPWLAAPLPCYSKIKETKIAGQKWAPNGSDIFNIKVWKAKRMPKAISIHFSPSHQSTNSPPSVASLDLLARFLRSGRRSVRRKRRRERSWRPCWTTCEANSLTTAGMKDVEEVLFNTLYINNSTLLWLYYAQLTVESPWKG